MLACVHSRGVCRKNSMGGSSGVARLLKVGDKDAVAEGIGYKTLKASSGEMPKASKGMGNGMTKMTNSGTVPHTNDCTRKEIYSDVTASTTYTRPLVFVTEENSKNSAEFNFTSPKTKTVDVLNTIHKLKSNKCDGSLGLSTDHF